MKHSVTKSVVRRLGFFFICASALMVFVHLFGSTAEASEGGIFNARLVAWVLAQLHLYFAAFILAVPVFVLIIEYLGVVSGESRYDEVAREFMGVSVTAHIVTIGFGVLFAVALFFYYPHLMAYLSKAFSPTYILYGLLIVVDIVLLYVYYFSWGRLAKGRAKKVHLLLGLALNLSGTLIMFIANAWTSFMMTPSGVGPSGEVDLWSAMNNPLWHPLNLHRFIANIAFGGAIVSAYAALRFLSTRDDAERSHYDWMGYVASIIAISALLPLPFAGYWLTAEIYSYSQQMGMTLMGGVFGWMFIVQAVVIGAIFLSGNYYLWCSMERSSGGKRYAGYVKFIALGLWLCFLVWFTPHTPVTTAAEAGAIGGGYHPLIGPLGLMPAKNIAVNMMILLTFISFLLYRRAPRVSLSPLAGYAKAVQLGLLTAAAANIVFLGVYYGYYTDNVHKVASSIPQVLTTFTAIVVCSVIEYFLYRGSASAGKVVWGSVGERSQYALILLAVAFTWLMGLMGFIRSAIRQHWHVYSVVRDTTADAFTPSISYASRVVSFTTIVFMLIVAVIFTLNIGRGRQRSKR